MGFNGTVGSTDFSGNAVGVGVPEGWTDLRANKGWAHSWEILAADDPSNDCPFPGKVLQAHADPSSSRTFVPLVWNEVLAPDGENGEVLALVRHIVDPNNNGLSAGLALGPRSTEAKGAGFGLGSTFFTAGYRVTDAGAAGDWYSSSALPRIGTEQWAWVRFQRIGTSLKGKWWLTTEEEPAVWRAEVTVADAPTGGQPGLFIRQMSNTTNGWMCRYFSFTTDPVTSSLSVPSFKEAGVLYQAGLEIPDAQRGRMYHAEFGLPDPVRGRVYWSETLLPDVVIPEGVDGVEDAEPDYLSTLLGQGFEYPFDWSGATGGADKAQAIQSVKASLMRLFDTAPGEQFMQPDYGCGLHRLVFEQDTVVFRALAETSIRSAVERWEPRVAEVLSVEIEEAGDNPHVILIRIFFHLIDSLVIENMVYPFHTGT